MSFFLDEGKTLKTAGTPDLSICGDAYRSMVLTDKDVFLSNGTSLVHLDPEQKAVIATVPSALAAPPEATKAVVGFDGTSPLLVWSDKEGVVYNRVTIGGVKIDAATIPSTVGKEPRQTARGKDDVAVLLSNGASLSLFSRTAMGAASMPVGLVVSGSIEGSARLVWNELASSYVVYDLHTNTSFQDVRQTTVVCKQLPTTAARPDPRPGGCAQGHHTGTDLDRPGHGAPSKCGRCPRVCTHTMAVSPAHAA